MPDPSPFLSPRLKSAAINAHAAFLALAIIALIAALLEIKPFQGPYQSAACSRSGERVATYRSDTRRLSLLELNSGEAKRESITIDEVLTVGPLKLQFIGAGQTHLITDHALVSVVDHSVGSLKGHGLPGRIPSNEIRGDRLANSFHVISRLPVEISTYDLTPDFTRNIFTIPPAVRRKITPPFSRIRVWGIHNRKHIAFTKEFEFFTNADGEQEVRPNTGFIIMDLDRNKTVFEAEQGDFLGFCGGGDFCVTANTGISPATLEVWQISSGKRVASRPYGDPVALSDDRMIVLDAVGGMMALSLPDLEETLSFRAPFKVPPKKTRLFSPYFNRFAAAEIVPDDLLRVILFNGELYDLDLSGQNRHRRISDLWRSRGENWSLIAIAGLCLGLMIAAVAAWRTGESPLLSGAVGTPSLQFTIRSIWIGAGATLVALWFADTVWTTNSFKISLSDSWISLLKIIPYRLWIGSLPLAFFALWRLLIWPLSRMWNQPREWTDSRFHFLIGLFFAAISAVAFYFNGWIDLNQ